tara:strand:+ start:237 stop:719 length:483 start_codon:yes stop_codon:yes gene_type:complete
LTGNNEELSGLRKTWKYKSDSESGAMVEETSIDNADTKKYSVLSSGLLGLLPTLGIILMPKCPACFAGLFGVLGILGLSLSDLYTTFVTVLVTGLIITVLFASVAGGRAQGLPVFMGLIFSVALIIVGRFVLFEDAPVYAGMFILSGVGTWKMWCRAKRF